MRNEELGVRGMGWERGQTGKGGFHDNEKPCRGRFHIGPACGGANARGRDQSRPYELILCFGPTGTVAATRTTVGRDAPIPPHPAAT